MHKVLGSIPAPKSKKEMSLLNAVCYPGPEEEKTLFSLKISTISTDLLYLGRGRISAYHFMGLNDFYVFSCQSWCHMAVIPTLRRLKQEDQEFETSLVLVAHTCNPSNSGDRDQEDRVSKPAQENSS
jgi:hypothetical protein